MPDYWTKNCYACGKNFSTTLSGERKCRGCRAVAKPTSGRRPQLGRPLSAREEQIVDLITDCLSNKQIALKLHLAEGSVKIYVSHVFAKLGFTKRVQVAMWNLRKKIENSCIPSGAAEL